MCIRDRYILNDVDKKKITEITKGEDTYQIIVDEISKVAKKDDKEKIDVYKRQKYYFYLNL